MQPNSLKHVRTLWYSCRDLRLNQLISSWLKIICDHKQNSFRHKTNSNGCPSTRILTRPFIFLLYINDLNKAVDCMPRFFADNTCLVVKTPSPKILEKKMDKKLLNLSLWCLSHTRKQTYNQLQKSQILIFPPKLTRYKSAIQQ